MKTDKIKGLTGLNFDAQNALNDTKTTVVQDVAHPNGWLNF